MTTPEHFDVRQCPQGCGSGECRLGGLATLIALDARELATQNPDERNPHKVAAVRACDESLSSACRDYSNQAQISRLEKDFPENTHEQ